MNTLFISVYHSLSISGPKIVPLTIRKLVFLPADHCSVLLSALLQFQHGGRKLGDAFHFRIPFHLWSDRPLVFFSTLALGKSWISDIFPMKNRDFIQNRPLKSMKRFRWNPPGTPSIHQVLPRAPCQVGAQLRASSEKRRFFEHRTSKPFHSPPKMDGCGCLKPKN